jgi:putative flippase GtrA
MTEIFSWNISTMKKFVLNQLLSFSRRPRETTKMNNSLVDATFKILFGAQNNVFAKMRRK